VTSHSRNWFHWSLKAKSIAFALLLMLGQTPFVLAEEVDGFVADETSSDQFDSAFASDDPYAARDPYESFNRSIFSFNQAADRYVLKPAAQAYQYVTPDFVDKGVTNFFNNLDDVETFANSLLQGKFHNAVVTLNRIIWNTTVGLFGLIDVATPFGLVNDEEDFGQTLAAWGYEDSNFIMLPLLGPSTFRDFTGVLVDGAAFDGLAYIEELNDDERWMLLGLKVVDLRADLLEAERLMTGGDRYVFLRNAYLQNRDYLINDGEIEDHFADDDFEVLEGF